MRKRFPDKLLGSKSSLRGLRVLNQDRTEMTGRELARRSAVSTAYDSREFTRTESADMLRDVGRFFEWAKEFFN